jgi:hypothetical protein
VPESRDHEVNLRRRRLVWLLDRLTPASSLAYFEPHSTEELAIYGWGRRLPPARRNELTNFAITPNTPGHWGRRMIIQALMLAWCDTCPNDRLKSILDWADIWRPTLKQHDICWLHDIDDEFYRRSTDIHQRYQPMLASLRKNMALFNDPDETLREIVLGCAFTLLMHLLRDAAIQNSAVVPFHATPDQYRPGWTIFSHRVRSERSKRLDRNC